jgi:hypothetical protein
MRNENDGAALRKLAKRSSRFASAQGSVALVGSSSTSMGAGFSNAVGGLTSIFPAQLMTRVSRCYSRIRMSRLRKFLCLDWQERRLFVQSVLLLTFLRAAFWLLPFKQINEYLARYAKRRRAGRDMSKERVISLVRMASAFLPSSTCLIQALAAKYQLERFGLDAQLHFGVAKENGRLLAHAWLQCDGETVLGGEIAPRYTPLVALN